MKTPAKNRDPATVRPNARIVPCANATLMLAIDGAFRITVDTQPTEAVIPCDRAVRELINYLERAVGGKLPSSTQVTPARFVVTLNADAKMGPEAFELSADRGGVRLLGKTPEAIEHGVHWFLERFVGVCWLWPGELGEVVPSHPTLTIPLGRWTEEPDYAWRRIGVGGALLEQHDYESANKKYLGLDEAHDLAFKLWAWRNRFGGLNIADGHRLGELLPAEKLGKDHPDFFALVNGKRDAIFYNGKHNNQPCTTNPGALDHIADRIVAKFGAEPSLDAISIGLNDGWRVCECEQCTEVDRAFKPRQLDYQHAAMAADIDPPPARHIDGTAMPTRSITDRIFRYVDEVWERTRKHEPDKKLLMLIYAACRKPPTKTHLPESVIAQFCTMCNRYTNPLWRNEELRDLRQLSEFTSHVGIYEYYEQGAWPAIIRLFPRLAAQSIKDYHNAGARYFATQPSYGFATTGVNLFVLGRTLWNVNADVERILKDYCVAAFGPLAATAMRRFFDAFEKRWIACDALQKVNARHPLLGLGQLYPDAFLKARKMDLDEAMTQGRDSNEQARVAFIQRGFELTCAVRNAFAATAALQETLNTDLWTDDFADHIPDSPTQRQRDLLSLALDHWIHATQTAECHKEAFVYSEFWFHYMPKLKDWPRPRHWQRPLEQLKTSWARCSKTQLHANSIIQSS